MDSDVFYNCIRLVAATLFLLFRKLISAFNLASSHRVNAIDPALRRYGRFDAEIEVTAPNEEERFQILKVVHFEIDGLKLSIA